jgi:hypothetical protein
VPRVSRVACLVPTVTKGPYKKWPNFFAPPPAFSFLFLFQTEGRSAPLAPPPPGGPGGAPGGPPGGPPSGGPPFVKKEQFLPREPPRPFARSGLRCCL